MLEMADHIIWFQQIVDCQMLARKLHVGTDITQTVLMETLVNKNQRSCHNIVINGNRKNSFPELLFLKQYLASLISGTLINV